ncbi:MAG: nitrilase [Desulfobacterales bacterium]|nr:nitrilase [Desulfobacterales bacterium]NOQ18661.1 nitrilase [Desulfobacterales bacterium]
MNDIRIAAVIMNCPVGRIQDNLDRMSAWVEAAKKQGADLICFPEMNTTGYSTRDEIKDSAETVPGPISQFILAMARESKIVILAGMAEEDPKGRVFASHLVVTPQGVAGIYRKIHIAPPEGNVFSAGDTAPVFEIQGVKLGIQLCYDVHFPELSTRMAIDGADVIFMPHASPRGTPEQKFNSWMRHLPARAFDNGLYVVACNQTGDNQNGLNFPGLSVIFNPSGQIIKKDTSGKEKIIIADLKAEGLAKVRDHRMRYFLPNRRPGLYYHEK